MTPNIMFLTKTFYLPQKRQIVVEFSNLQRKASKRYTFFPFFFLPNNSKFADLIKKFDSKRLRVEALNEKTLRVIAATFLDLKKSAELIKSSFKKEVLLVEPQRQFLIEKNWSYFDCFSIEGKELIKEKAIAPPDVFLDFLSSSTQKAFFDLKKNNEKTAKEFLEKICLSNLLKKSTADLPTTNPGLYELFLENMFFKNKFPFLSNPKNNFFKKDFDLKQDLGGFSKINFLRVLNSLVTFPFYNLGFDSINCKCCNPKNFGKKISPSSLVEAEFLADGVYFESSFKRWALHFHSSKPFKLQRINFQKEWCLNSVPVGPFFSGKNPLIPFVDFKFLEEKNLVKNSFTLVKSVWFCQKHESFLSKEIKEYHNLLSKISNSSSKVQTSKIVSVGILFSKMLSNDFSHFYFKTLLEQLKKLSGGVFLSLLEPNCRFFDQRIADSLECIQNGVMKNFEKFAEENGSQSTKIRAFNAFIKVKNPLFVARKFSHAFKLPFPEISF